METPGLLKVATASRLSQLNILPWLPKVYIKIQFLSNPEALDFIPNVRKLTVHFCLISEDHKTVSNIGTCLRSKCCRRLFTFIKQSRLYYTRCHCKPASMSVAYSTVL